MINEHDITKSMLGRIRTIINENVDAPMQQGVEVQPTEEPQQTEQIKDMQILKDGNVVSIKIWSDSNNRINDLDTVLVGHEISYDNVVRDYYFTGSIESVNTLIQSSDLNYEIKEFDTHKHFLYSIKYDISNNILNFKTYYILNEHAMYYTNEMIPHLKKILTFN